MPIKTPYVPHLFGDAAREKLRSRQGWLTTGVASSIAWPQADVCILYDGHEYVLRGVQDGEKERPPCISTPCPRDDTDAVTTRLYKFASVLGWFKGGYVDLTGSIWGSSPVLYGSRDTFTTIVSGSKYFTCNYLPIIEDDQVRKALAFMREGRRLRHVHEPYSFLSFFKVLESQFSSKDRVAWIQANLDQLDGDAAKRVAELRAKEVDVSMHLFESGRCAIAHASLTGTMVDPDIPTDRRRIREDLEIMSSLAARYLRFEVGVPDDMELYEKRDRTEPWHKLLPAETLRRLQQGEQIMDPAALGQLQQTKVSVRLWPHNAPEPMRSMTLAAEGYGPGLIQLVAYSERKTVFLRFVLDIAHGRLHTVLRRSVITNQFNEPTEVEVEHYTRYFHSVVGNALAELLIDGVEPIPCEIVIPANITPHPPEKMVALALEQLRQRKKDTEMSKSTLADSATSDAS